MAVIAATTVIASVLLIVTGRLGWGAVQGGFIPARLTAELPADHLFAIPFALTPLTATLVHGGFLHLLLNLVILVFCGRQVERALGAGPLVALYVAGAYLAAAMHWLFEPGSAVPMVGASGAISALVAAYALLFGERRAKPLGPIPANVIHVAWLAAAWIGIQFLIGVAGVGGVTVAIGAHIGGFVAGLILARPLLLWRYRRA